MEFRKRQEQLTQAWPNNSMIATTAQLAEADFGPRALASALDLRLVFRLRKGAYVQAEQWRGAKPWNRDKLRLLAHMMSTRGEPVYSYASAARLHGLFVWNCDAVVHVSVPTAASGTSGAGDVRAHREKVAAAERQVVEPRQGLQVLATTLERTVVDCARRYGFAEAVVIGDHALRTGASLETMWSMVNAVPGRRGVRKARRVLRALDGKSESPGETRVRLIIAQMNIAQPDLQVELMVAGYNYRPDFVWTQQKVIVEVDGHDKYFAYRPTAEVLLDERKREKRLIEAGWSFVRLDWDDLGNPEEVQRRIHNAFNAGQVVVAA